MTLQQCLGPSDGMLQDYLGLDVLLGCLRVVLWSSKNSKTFENHEANTRPMTAKKIIVIAMGNLRMFLAFFSTTKRNGEVCE